MEGWLKDQVSFEQLLPEEQSLFKKINQGQLKDVVFARTSYQRFDFHFEGHNTEQDINVVAWFPLWAVKHATDWTSKEVANMSSNPKIAMEGDWSALRDEDEEIIWKIFETFVLQ
jgi:hypothetical protein